MNTPPLSTETDLRATEPSVISAFVQGVNAAALTVLIDLFAHDAHVNDQLRNFWGCEAIARWLEQEIIGDNVRLLVLKVREHYDTQIVEAEMSGAFSQGSSRQPLGVDLHFTARAGRIVRLLVLLRRDEGAEPEVRRVL